MGHFIEKNDSFWRTKRAISCCKMSHFIRLKNVRKYKCLISSCINDSRDLRVRVRLFFILEKRHSQRPKTDFLLWLFKNRNEKKGTVLTDGVGFGRVGIWYVQVWKRLFHEQKWWNYREIDLQFMNCKSISIFVSPLSEHFIYICNESNTITL